MHASNPGVAEIQGLYGAFGFPEKLLQKIWLRGDFDRTAIFTADGQRVRIRHPGKWNLLGGPDFRGARLAIGDGTETVGDVEVHLRAPDWDAHGHARDPAYNDVVLHVVLFPPEPGRVTRGVGGREIPVVSLLSLLHHDLEEFAAEEVVEVLASRPSIRVTEELALLPPAELIATLRGHALSRWRQKVHFARLRVTRLGWNTACHHAALEILGYRFNRSPMLRIAGQWPLRAWVDGAVHIEEAFASEREGWSLQGVRPANHPRTRLRQYERWIRLRPDWTQHLIGFGEGLPEIDPASATRDARRVHRLTKVREEICREVCGEGVGGTRFDNVVCDGLLPLLAARTDRELDGLWLHWFSGDLPVYISRGLRDVGVCDGRERPACHGFAQGLLGWLIDHETRGQ